MATATSLRALAAETARNALAACPSVQTWLGVADAAEAEALIFIVDAGLLIEGNSVIVNVEPDVPEDIGGDLLHVYTCTAEFTVLPPAGTGEDDFIESYNFEKVAEELWDQRYDHNFELTQPLVGDPVRLTVGFDENNEERTEIITPIVFGAEAMPGPLP